jgi:hypothetical protein
LANKPKPHSDEEVLRLVGEARPGAKATEPSFDFIIEAIIEADPEKMREHHEEKRRTRMERGRSQK